MLLERSKEELEDSMKGAVHTFGELESIRQSFSFAQRRFANGNLADLVNGIKSARANSDKLTPEDFAGGELMTPDNFLLRYNHETGFFPYVTGFVFQYLDGLANKINPISRPSHGAIVLMPETLSTPPFSDTGIILAQGHSAGTAVYTGMTLTAHSQYSKNQFFDLKKNWTPDRQLYNAEAILMITLLDHYIMAKILSRDGRIEVDFESILQSLVRKEFEPHLSYIQRELTKSGAVDAPEVIDKLRIKVYQIGELLASFPKSSSKPLVDAFFRFGTSKEDVTDGILYSPLNDASVYFGIKAKK